jgi:hypothetical protein
MNNIVRMRMIQGVADLSRYFHDAREIAGWRFSETRPVHQLHHKERHSVLLADVVDRDNVWVIQGSGGPRFTEQTLARIRRSRL